MWKMWDEKIYGNKMIGIGIFVFLYLGRNLITHKAMFLCFFPLVFLREVVVVLKHEKPLSVLWMQRNCSLSIFLDEQFNLFIRVTFTYPLQSFIYKKTSFVFKGQVISSVSSTVNSTVIFL